MNRQGNTNCFVFFMKSVRSRLKVECETNTNQINYKLHNVFFKHSDLSIIFQYLSCLIIVYPSTIDNNYIS